jgi:hypothetical protein
MSHFEGEDMNKHNDSVPSEVPFEDVIKTPQVTRRALKDDGTFPNN